MYFTGFADEAGLDFDVQIKATKELGWKYIESRRIGEKTLATLTDAEFEDVCSKLAKSGIEINCYGSAIANWSRPITESPESSYEEMRKAIPRMDRLGIKLVRVMSFAVPQELKPKSWDYLDEVVKRMKVIVKMAEDAGVVCVHENCMNWGGLSYEHTLRLLEKIDSPAFKLVYDTGNPVFNDEIRGDAPYKKQSSWEFYRNVREHVAYIHIKDAVMKDGKQVFTFAGDGEGDVVKILRDLVMRGYDGGFSMEPHMGSVFHGDDNNPEAKAKFCYDNYVEYGRRFMALLSEVKVSSAKK